MAITVPVNPNTQPASQLQDFLPEGKKYDTTGAFKGMEVLGEALQRRQQKQVEDLRQQDQFVLNSKLLSTINDRQQDFQARQTDPNTDVKSFFGQVNNDYSAEDQKLIAQASAAGYSKEAVRSFALGLAQSTNSFLGKAIDWQHQQQRAGAASDAGNVIDQGTRYVAQNPDSDPNLTIGAIQHTIDLNPWLEPDERQVLKDKAKDAILTTSGQAFTEANPQKVIDVLGKHFYKPDETAGAPVGQSSNPWAQVAVNVANKFGLNPDELGAIMSFESGLDPTRTNASGHLGLIQFGKAEQAKYGIDKSSTPEQWTQAITKFFEDRGLKHGSNIMDVYSTILAGAPGRYDAKDSNGTTVRNAVPRILQDHVPKAQAWIGQLTQPQTTQLAANDQPAQSTGGYVALVPPMQRVNPDTGQPADGQVMGYKVVTNSDQSQWNKRTDGTDKGTGWLGVLQRPDGGVSSEISVGVNLGGKEQEIPLMVPGLTKPQLDYLMTNDPGSPGFLKNLPQGLMQKAMDHAKEQIAAGKSPFAEAQSSTPVDFMNVKTGIPQLDGLTGAQQLTMVNRAQALLQQKNAQDRALIQQQVENAKAANMAGQPAGYVPPLADLQRVLGNVQGAAVHGDLQATAAAQPIIAGMKTANGDALQAQVAALKPNNPNDPDYASKLAIWSKVNEAATQNLALRQRDPASYMLNAFPQLASQIDGAKNVSDQRAAYKAMENAYTQLGVPKSQWSPITKDQADAMSSQYLAANPQQRLGILNQWFGALAGSQMIPQFVATLAQANRKFGPSIAQDAFLYATLYNHPEFSGVMQDAMAGAAAQIDTSRRISTAAADKNWRTTFGPTAPYMNAAASENYKQVAIDLYVNAGGHVPTSQTDPLDQKLWDESVRRAVGGLKNNPDTGYFYAQGKGRPATILPPAVTKQEFQNWTDNLTPHALAVASGQDAALTKYGKPAFIRDIQDYGTFVMRAPGIYAIQMQDGGTLMSSRGGEYRVHLTPQIVRGK